MHKVGHQVVDAGARVVGVKVAKELVQAFVGAQFSGDERHVRRSVKVKAMEE